MKEGIRKLKFAQQIKKAEGTKTPKVSWRDISFFSGKENEVIMIFQVELTVSVDGVAIQESKSKKILHQYPLHR